MKKLILALLFIPAALSANERGACAQKAALDMEFTLKHGGCAVVAKIFEIQFLKISSDSRCPSDVQCKSAGNVTAFFTVKQKGAAPATIQIDSNRNSGSAIYRKNAITLQDVAPIPISTRSLPQEEYTATLLVSKTK